jgi:segregation and condensation protein A
MKKLNFDIAGEYLLMASKLLYLKSECAFDEKSKQLEMELEDENLDFETKDQLIKKLEELKKFQEMGSRLWDLPKLGHEIFLKPKVNKKKYFNSIVKNMECFELQKTMIDLLRREKKKVVFIQKERMSIKSKVLYFQEFLQQGKEYLLSDLIQEPEKISDRVLTFISVLELARLKKFGVYQNQGESPIYIQVLKSMKDIDMNEVEEFSDELPGEEAETNKEDEVPTENLVVVNANKPSVSEVQLN